MIKQKQELQSALMLLKLGDATGAVDHMINVLFQHANFIDQQRRSLKELASLPPVAHAIARAAEAVADFAEDEQADEEAIAAKKTAAKANIKEAAAVEKAEAEKQKNRAAAETKAKEVLAKAAAENKATEEVVAAEKAAAEKKAKEEALPAEKAAVEKKAQEEACLFLRSVYFWSFAFPVPGLLSFFRAEKAAAETQMHEAAAEDKKATEQALALEKAATEEKANEEVVAAEKAAAEKKAREEALAAEKDAVEKKAKEAAAAEKAATEEKAKEEAVAVEKAAAEKKAKQEALAAEKAAVEKKAKEATAAAKALALEKALALDHYEQAIAPEKAATEEKAKKEVPVEAEGIMMMDEKAVATETAAAEKIVPKTTYTKEAIAALVAQCEPAASSQARSGGEMWAVVGGKGQGGIIVRRGEKLSSKVYSFKLTVGSQIEQIERKGNRLHYKRIRGDGPDFGWVSIEANGDFLVQDYDETKIKEEALAVEKAAAEKKAKEVALAAEKAEAEKKMKEAAAADKAAVEKKAKEEQTEHEARKKLSITPAEEDWLQQLFEAAAEKPAKEHALDVEKVAAEKKAKEEVHAAAEKITTEAVAEKIRMMIEKSAAAQKAAAGEKAKEEALAAEKVAAEKKAREEVPAAAKAAVEKELQLIKAEAEKNMKEAAAADKAAAEKKAKEVALAAEKVAAEEKAKEEALAAEKAAAKKIMPKIMYTKDEIAVLVEKCKPAMSSQARSGGEMWAVVGGKDKGSIKVSRGKCIDSLMYSMKLTVGSQIEQIERKGNRLHYKRIRGDGPDFGWVSIEANGDFLVQPHDE